MPNETTPPPSENQSPARPRRRWRRIILRTSVRIIVGLGLILGAIIALICFTPLSFQWADNKLRQSVQRATGLHFDFGRAEWTVSRGFLRITSPTFSDPASNEKLLELNDLEVNFGFGTFARSIFGKADQTRIESVAATGPVELNFEQKEGRIELDPRLKRIKEIVQERKEENENGNKSKGGNGFPAHRKFHIGRVDLNGINLALDQIDGEERTRLGAVEDGNFLAEFDESSSSPKSILYVARLQGEEYGTGIKLQIEPKEGNDAIGIKLALQRFDTQEHIMAEVPVNFRTTPANIQGMLRRKAEDDWVLYANTDIEKIVLIGQGQDGEDETIDQVKLYAAVEWAQKEDLLRFITVELKSQQADAAAQGKLSLVDNLAYQVHVESSEFRGGAISIVESHLLKDGDVTNTPLGKVKISGDLSGQAKERKFDSTALTFSVDDLGFTLPDIPEPITNVRVKGALSNTELVLSEGFAVVQGIPIRAGGTFKGQLLEGKVDRADINWETSGKAQGLSELIAENSSGGAMSDLTFKGDVMGSGTFRVQNPEPGEWSELLDKGKLEGQLKFNDAEVAYAKLKKPIRKLRGAIEVKNDTAVFKSVSGEIEDVSFSVEGHVKGRKQFWKDSKTTFTAQASLNLENLKDYYAWADLEIPEDLPELKGQVKVAGTAGGPVKDWRAFDFRADLSADNFSLPIDTEHFKATVHAPRLQLALTASEARIVKAEGDVDGIGVRLQGTMTPNSGRITLDSETQLTEFKRVLPKLLEDYIIAGPAEVAHTVELERTDQQEHPAKTFIELFSAGRRSDKGADQRSDKLANSDKRAKSAKSRKPKDAEPEKPAEKPRPPLKEQWKVSHKGQVDLKNCDVAFYTMPTRLTNALGKVNYDDDHLWTPKPVAVKTGEHARDTQVDMSLVFGKGGNPTMMEGRVTGEFVDLDDWLGKWKKPTPKTPPADEPEGKLKFKLHVVADTRGVAYKGVQGEQLTGELTYSRFTRRQGRLVWENARATSKNGWIVANGQWDHRPDDDQQVFTFKADHMDVADLVNAFSDEPREGGLASGVISGGLTISRPGLHETPFNGEGTILIEQSRFVSNAIFGKLGTVLGLEEIFNDITFPRIEGSFDVVDDAVVMKDKKFVRFENPSLIYPLDIKAQGQIGPKRALDLDLHLQFLSRVSKIPIVGRVWDVVNKLTGKILQAHVTGTTKNPDVSLLPRL